MKPVVVNVIFQSRSVKLVLRQLFLSDPFKPRFLLFSQKPFNFLNSLYWQLFVEYV